MRRATRQVTLGFGAAIALSLTCDDAAAARWLEECLEGWFVPTDARADWRVRLTCDADAHARLTAGRPSDVAPLICFAFDTYCLALPAWRVGERTIVEDAERHCFLVVAPSEIQIVAHPGTPRWRFTALLVVLEIVATRMRRACLDVHAAAVASDDHALLVMGPKGAGKTTLVLSLLRGGGWQWLGNDRAFVRELAREPPVFEVVGVPGSVNIRAATAAGLPELRRGMGAVERPYLLSLGELEEVAREGTPAAVADLALSTAQVRQRLGIDARASARLAAVVYPEFDPACRGWSLERLSPSQVLTRSTSCLFGQAATRDERTLIERQEGGRQPPLPSLAERLSLAIPGYRLPFGPGAADEEALAARLGEIATAGRPR